MSFFSCSWSKSSDCKCAKKQKVLDPKNPVQSTTIPLHVICNDLNKRWEKENPSLKMSELRDRTKPSIRSEWIYPTIGFFLLLNVSQPFFILFIVCSVSSQISFTEGFKFSLLFYSGNNSEQIWPSSLISSWTRRRSRSWRMACCCSASTPSCCKWCSFSLSRARPDMECLMMALCRVAIWAGCCSWTHSRTSSTDHDDTWLGRTIPSLCLCNTLRAA